MKRFNLSKNQRHYIGFKVQARSLLILSLLILNSSFTYANGAVISSCDKVPSGYNGKVFRIKTDYPTEISNAKTRGNIYHLKRNHKNTLTQF